jgi:hypothetical protein
MTTITLRLTSVTALLVALSMESTAAPFIWPASSGGNGHAYEFVPANGVAWSSAKNAAASMSYQEQFGYLATVSTQPENDFLFNLRPSPTATFQGSWIGVHIASNVQTWETGPETGSSLDYKNWGGGEPNNGGSSAYGYMHIGSGTYAGITPGKWADAGGGIANPSDPVIGYFVEYSIPEPRGRTLFYQLAIAVIANLRRRAGA